MTPRRQDTPAAAAPLPPWPGAPYLRDVLERTVLFADTLRRRGNPHLEHLAAGEPPLLTFEHEPVLDGRSLPRPCNDALVRVLPLPDAPTDPAARVVVVVDPRAGHPVYFVTFRPQPEPGQTLADVLLAKARFLEEVRARHPQCPARPVVIGNRQAGWATSMLASLRPGLFGALVIVGAPLSYWAGGSRLRIRPDPPDETLAVARAEAELQVHRQQVLPEITDGGFARAVCRIVLADLLPDRAAREQALAVAAAVLMIEPTLANPRSEIVEMLIGTLDVDPVRVMDLACRLTAPLAVPALTAAPARRRPARRRTSAPTQPSPRRGTTRRAGLRAQNLETR